MKGISILFIFEIYIYIYIYINIYDWEWSVHVKGEATWNVTPIMEIPLNVTNHDPRATTF
jgi:hypothetical protein